MLHSKQQTALQHAATRLRLCRAGERAGRLWSPNPVDLCCMGGPPRRSGCKGTECTSSGYRSKKVSSTASTCGSSRASTAPPIRLGDNTKVIGLCRTYYRLSTGYWLEEALPDQLYAGTICVRHVDKLSERPILISKRLRPNG